MRNCAAMGQGSLDHHARTMWKEILGHPALEPVKALEAKCRKNQNHPKTPYFCLKRKAFLEIRTKNDSQIWINLASPRFIVCLPIISCERFAWKRSVPAPQAAASGVPAAPALSDATRLARFSSWPPTWTQILSQQNSVVSVVYVYMVPKYV